MTKRGGAAAVVLVSALFATGCSALGAEEPQESPEAQRAPEALATYEGDPLADLSLVEVPLAGAPTADEAARTDVIGLTDARLLTTKPGAENVIMLEALDTESGQLAWDITLWESRQIAIDAGLDASRPGARPTGRLELSDAVAQRTGGDAVYVPVFGNVCSDDACANQSDIDSYDGGYRSGIVSLNAGDGSVRWATDITSDLGDRLQGISLHPAIADATGETTLANVEAQTDDGDEATIAVALNSETGEVRWVEQGVVVSAIAGDVVTAVRAEDPRGAEGELVGLDAATGDEVWSVGETGAWAPQGARGSLAAVAAPDAEVVDARTGEHLRMGRFPVDPQLGDGFVAWLDSADGTVFSYDEGGERAQVGERAVSGAAVRAVSDDDYLWIATGGEDPQLFAADRTGAVHSDPLPGELVDVRASSVATVTPDGAVHLWRYSTE